MMKHLNKYLSLALALVLCLSLAACGESNEDYGDGGSDYNLYGVPDSFEGLVKRLRADVEPLPLRRRVEG